MGCCLPFRDSGITEAYTLVKKIGEGAEGEVWIGIEKATGCRYALKFISCSRGSLPKKKADRVCSEVQISVELGEGHVNIVRPHELILTHDNLVLVAEYFAGGTLEKYIQSHTITEDKALYLFLQIVSALAFCHAKGIVYRDVKPENTLLDDSESRCGEPPVVQLCDFGVARRGAGDESHRMTTLMGTPGFISPQVIRAGLKKAGPTGSYDGAKADVWSAGVLLFFILTEELPIRVNFRDYALDPMGVLEEALRQQSKKGTLEERLSPAARNAIRKLSPEAPDLLSKMLEVDEEQRITMKEVEGHPWCTRSLEGSPDLAAKLNQLREKQASLDAGEGLPRYLARDGDALIHGLVQRAYKISLGERAPEDVGRKGILGRLSLTWAALPQDTVSPLKAMDMASTAALLKSAATAPPKARSKLFDQDLESHRPKLSGGIAVPSFNLSRRTLDLSRRSSDIGGKGTKSLADVK